ncbi:Formate/nitrite transporter-domain-containing protein [Apodospora peruviana]|uniref:Formate/nitrite transporter-domain-containing protein n=1 Tax=Apodospora peruviana TaxID=516989 RepID=A0AAE0HX41_9PEZI|nr:Formate/nitrite transporter-domain-containing protein [Apodospora peruviana]
MSNPLLVNVGNPGISYTPAQTLELVSRAGARKGRTKPHIVFISAVSGGCMVGFAVAAFLAVVTAPWYQENAPGFIRMIGALIFPSGLVMIVLTGAELFTGTTMFTTVAVLHGRLSVWRMLLHWFLCFWGNFAGSLFVTLIIFGYGGGFDSPPYRDQVIATATSKQVTPSFHQIFLRGIGCNWLVCMAIYLGMQAKDINSKIVAMWWPIFAFGAAGLEHVVANMSFIPLAIFHGTPDLSIGLYIWKGIIPSGLGNIIGGALFCGVYYWWIFIYRESEIMVDGTYYEHQPQHVAREVQNLDAEKGAAPEAAAVRTGAERDMEAGSLNMRKPPLSGSEYSSVTNLGN